jgi:hypothetical protein
MEPISQSTSLNPENFSEQNVESQQPVGDAKSVVSSPAKELGGDGMVQIRGERRRFISREVLLYLDGRSGFRLVREGANCPLSHTPLFDYQKTKKIFHTSP